MNKILLLPVLVLFITGCASKEKEETKPFDYCDVTDLTISWNQILSVKSNDYYTYIYSSTCGHCNEIKQIVISYALGNYGSLYFVEFNKDISRINDPLSTIDKSSIEDLGIVGTPSMFRIKDHIVIENIVGSKQIIETLTKSTQ